MTFSDTAVEAIGRLKLKQSYMTTKDDCWNYRNWAKDYQWEADLYESAGFRVEYYKLFPERVDVALQMLEKIGLEEVPGGSIVSIGCGFGAELVAAFDYLQQQKNGQVPGMTFVGIDPVRGWQDCFDVFNSDRFEFVEGKLSADEQEQRILCDRLKEYHAAMVVLSHVVLDFAGKFIGPVIEKMFEVETLQRVVILERLSDRNYPEAPRGCQRLEKVIRLDTGRKKKTKMIVYQRLPESSSSDEDSSSGGDSGERTRSDEDQAGDSTFDRDTVGGTDGQNLGSDAEDADQVHESDVDSVTERLRNLSTR